MAEFGTRALWVISVPPRDLSWTTGKHATKTCVVSRAQEGQVRQEGPVSFQKGLASEESCREGERQRGTDSCRAWSDTKTRGGFPGYCQQQEGLSRFTWGKMRKREKTG